MNSIIHRIGVIIITLVMVITPIPLFSPTRQFEVYDLYYTNYHTFLGDVYEADYIIKIGSKYTEIKYIKGVDPFVFKDTLLNNSKYIIEYYDDTLQINDIKFYGKR